MGIGAIASAGASLAQLATQKSAERRQQGYQKELMGLQSVYNKQAGVRSQQLGMKTWDETNYGAQVEHMKKAGLSTGLMYGGSGAGGATTGGAMEQGVSGGNAPQAKGMDIGQIASIGLMTAQSEKLKAETENIKEGTEKTHIEGRGEMIRNLIEEIGMGYTGGEGAKRSADHYGQIEMKRDSPTARAQKATPEKMEQEITNLRVEERAKEAGINLTEESARKIYHDIIQGYMDKGLKALDVIGIIKKHGRR